MRPAKSEPATEQKGRVGGAGRTRLAAGVKPARATVAGKRAGAGVATAKPRKASVPASKSAKAQGRKAGGKNQVKTVRQAKRTSSVQAKTRGKEAIVAVPRVVKIRALDPQVRCGRGTSVQHLFRVDEQGNGKGVTTHLVFFDRHGWYCEHGRTCPAVEDVRKSQRQLVRINQVG